MANRAPRAETLNYRLGGFHPVHLDDVFKKGRYTVIHKLGHGGFATVWLARDKVRLRYVALKILAARLSHDCPEVEILRRLRESEDHEGKAFVMSMLDHFWIDGPNGHHLCVVSEVGGPSIKQFNECPGLTSGSRRLRGAVARKVASQATEGLAYIHSTGTVHGDFTAANILLQLANIDEWTIDEIHERLGVPQTRDLCRVPGGAKELTGPRYTVNAISMKLVDPQWLSDQIIIIDFGIAFLEEQSSNDIGTPKAYCAPEFNFHSPRSRSSDIWALGCTIFEIRTGTSLFRYRGAPTRDQILISMVQVLGTLPDIWWKQWKEGRNWYDVEIKDGGELAGNIIGTLFRQIMQIGLHDGDAASITRKNSDFKKAPEEPKPTQPSLSDRHRESTDRLVALVEELTTSEAADVMDLVNKPSSRSSQEPSEEKASSGSGNKNQTGSGSGSGSSHPKSSEKSSIPSEGISTGKADSGSGMGSGVGTGMGTEGQVSASVALDKAAGIATEDFLESPGTIIAVAEAAGLENLLRTALAFLPEKRLPADEIATHHWFSENYESAVTN